MNPMQMIQKSLATIAKQMPAVEGQMEPDTRSMLLNVLSMLQEVLGIGQTAPEPEIETMVEEQIADTSQDDEQIEKEKKVEKPIGDEGVDTRLEDQTPVTDNALSEIGKSLNSIKTLLSGNQVQKTRQPVQQNTAMMKTMATMTQVLKGLANKVDQNQQFMGKFMETIGISDDIVKKALEPPAVSTTPENRPAQTADMMSFMTEFMKTVNQNNQVNKSGAWPVNKQSDPWQQKGDVRKSLDPVLDHLFSK